MTEREFEIEVAEKVMGIKLCKHEGHPKCEKCGLNHSHWHRITPPDYYATDPTADYTVLQHVRQHWCRRMPAAGGTPPYYGDFYWTLRDIWYDRKWPRNTVPSCHRTWECDLYEPGDYSRAALAAMKKGNS